MGQVMCSRCGHPGVHTEVVSERTAPNTCPTQCAQCHRDVEEHDGRNSETTPSDENRSHDPHADGHHRIRRHLGLAAHNHLSGIAQPDTRRAHTAGWHQRGAHSDPVKAGARVDHTSPVVWPRLSLTTRKRSRSIIDTPRDRTRRRSRSTAWLVRFLTTIRCGKWSPVKERRGPGERDEHWSSRRDRGCRDHPLRRW